MTPQRSVSHHSHHSLSLVGLCAIVAVRGRGRVRCEDPKTLTQARARALYGFTLNAALFLCARYRVTLYRLWTAFACDKVTRALEDCRASEPEAPRRRAHSQHTLLYGFTAVPQLPSTTCGIRIEMYTIMQPERYRTLQHYTACCTPYSPPAPPMTDSHTLTTSRRPPRTHPQPTAPHTSTLYGFMGIALHEHHEVAAPESDGAPGALGRSDSSHSSTGSWSSIGATICM